ncbi:MAG: hypothetical protein ABIQ49_15615 [Gemmatimonadales bacterium]
MESRPTRVAALIGSLDGAPERVRSIEQPKPGDIGNACLYRMEARPSLGLGGVLVEVSPTAGIVYERVAGGMRQHFAAALRDGSPGTKGGSPR